MSEAVGRRKWTSWAVRTVARGGGIDRSRETTPVGRTAAAPNTALIRNQREHEQFKSRRHSRRFDRRIKRWFDDVSRLLSAIRKMPVVRNLGPLRSARKRADGAMLFSPALAV
jgi:hypothetical protein